MTTSSDDYLGFLTPPPAGFGYRQGLVTAWDVLAGTNTVNVAGTNLTNLPLITQADVYNIRVNDPVAVVKFNDSYAILGKIKQLNEGSLWMPVPLYPLFVSIIGAGAGGYAQVPAGTLVSWEGRLNATHHSRIHIDGIWGQASGSNTATFELTVGGIPVGSWTETNTFSVANRGPYDISTGKDQPFIKVQLNITASSGSGNVAFQVLACFLR